MLPRFDAEVVTEIIRQIDKRHDELIARRQLWETQAVDKILAAVEGSAPAPHKSILVKLYTNLKDMTLPSLCRKLHARETAWLDHDFFMCQPDGVESTDIEGFYWITDYLRDNLNNENSRFHSVMRAAIWQREILNIAAIGYKWIVWPKINYDYSMSLGPEGVLLATSERTLPVPLEYELQGVQYQIINIFNLYPDIVGVTEFDDLRKLNLHSSYYAPFADLVASGEFDPMQPYPFEVNTLYRDNSLLKQLKDNETARFSSAQWRLLGAAGLESSPSSDSFARGQVEVRTAIVKEFKHPETRQYMDGEGRGYRFVYAKQGGRIFPLLAEKNLFAFEQKTIRLSRKWIEPTFLYNDSEVGMAINQHFYIVASKQLQASALSLAAMPPKLWSSQLIDAFQGSVDELKKFFREPGGEKFVNLSKLFDATGQDHAKSISLIPVEESLRNLELFEQAIRKAKMDIQQINSQVNQETGAGATAQYNRQVAQELDFLSAESRAGIVRDWIQPSLEYAIEMAKIAFQDQKLTTPIGDIDRNHLIEAATKAKAAAALEEGREETVEGVTWEELKRAATEKQSTIPRLVNVGGKNGVITYNPLTEKKQIILNKGLFRASKTSFKWTYEEAEHSSAYKLEELVQLYGNIIQSVPDSPLKYLVVKLAIMKSLQITKDSSYTEIAEEAEKLYQQMIAPSAEEQIKLAAETQKAQADARQKEATAQKQEAEAAKITQEVDVNNRLMGVY